MKLAKYACQMVTAIAAVYVPLDAHAFPDLPNAPEQEPAKQRPICVDAGVKSQQQIQDELLKKGLRALGHGHTPTGYEAVVRILDQGQYFEGQVCGLVALTPMLPDPMSAGKSADSTDK